MFIERLKELIESKNLTQKQFLEEIGLNKNSIRNWEQNNNIPNKAVLLGISTYFNISIEYLIGKTNEKKPLAQSEELTEQEQILINSFRETTEQGRIRIIQTVMNICDEIEKKDTTQNTKHSS